MSTVDDGSTVLNNNNNNNNITSGSSSDESFVLSSWLKQNKLESIQSILEQREIDISEVMEFDSNDLQSFCKDLGMDTLHTRRFIKAIEELKIKTPQLTNNYKDQAYQDIWNENIVKKSNNDRSDIFNGRINSAIIRHITVTPDEQKCMDLLNERDAMVEMLMREIENGMNKLDIQVNDCGQMIEKVVDDFIQQVKQTNDTILQESERIVNYKNTLLHEQKEQCTKDTELLQQIDQNYNEWLNNPNMDNDIRRMKLLSAFESYVSGMKPLRLATQPQMHFVQNEELLDQMMRKIKIDPCNQPTAPIVRVVKATYKSIQVAWEVNEAMFKQGAFVFEIQYRLLHKNEQINDLDNSDSDSDEMKYDNGNWRDGSIESEERLASSGLDKLLDDQEIMSTKKYAMHGQEEEEDQPQEQEEEYDDGDRMEAEGQGNDNIRTGFIEYEKRPKVIKKFVNKDTEKEKDQKKRKDSKSLNKKMKQKEKEKRAKHKKSKDKHKYTQNFEWTTAEIIRSSDKRKYTITGLDFSSTYKIRIRGKNEAGWGKFSTPVIAKTHILMLQFKKVGHLSGVRFADDKTFVQTGHSTAKIPVSYEINLRNPNFEHFGWEVVCWTVSTSSWIGFLQGPLKKERSYSWNTYLGSSNKEFSLCISPSSTYISIYRGNIATNTVYTKIPIRNGDSFFFVVNYKKKTISVYHNFFYLGELFYNIPRVIVPCVSNNGYMTEFAIRYMNEVEITYGRGLYGIVIFLYRRFIYGMNLGEKSVCVIIISILFLLVRFFCWLFQLYNPTSSPSTPLQKVQEEL